MRQKLVKLLHFAIVLDFVMTLLIQLLQMGFVSVWQDSDDAMLNFCPKVKNEFEIR